MSAAERAQRCADMIQDAKFVQMNTFTVHILQLLFFAIRHTRFGIVPITSYLCQNAWLLFFIENFAELLHLVSGRLTAWSLYNGPVELGSHIVVLTR
jgi:hypothetical protein